MTNTCVICGRGTTRTTTEKVTGEDLLVPCHEGCEQKARRNSLYGEMVSLTESIEAHIEENGPIDQDEVERLWGPAGLAIVRRLMQRGVVSYTIDWELQIDERHRSGEGRQ